MKFLLLVFFLELASSVPTKTIVKPKKYGNPDEWGPYYQGDMKFRNPNQKNGMLDENLRWPNGQVTYAYDTNFAESKKPTVEQAMQSYSDLTNGCITFKERTAEANYVIFTGDDNDGCYSYVGMIGGQQQINYPQWCIDQYGSVQHEMLHALGFQHEQSSPDRDGYVTMQWENIEPEYIYAFAKCDYDTCTTYGQPYDYNSVMHYSGYAFSKNGELTIITTDPAYQSVIGQRDGLSDIDITKLMLMYNC